MMGAYIRSSDAERVVRDYFIECVKRGVTEVEITEANADLIRRLEQLPVVTLPSNGGAVDAEESAGADDAECP